MGAASSFTVKIPRWQCSYATEHSNSEFANATTRANLKERLLGDNYALNITQAGELNKEVKDAFLNIVGTKDYSEDADETCIDDDEDNRGIHSRWLAVELVVGMGSRLRNKNIYNFFTVILSILSIPLLCSTRRYLGDTPRNAFDSHKEVDGITCSRTRK